MSDVLAFGGVVVISACSYMIYFAIAYNGPILERVFAFIGFLSLAGYLSFGIYIMGRVYKISKDLADSWNYIYIGQTERGRNYEIERRQFKLLKPLEFHVISMYRITEKSTIRFWEFLIDKTILLYYCFPLAGK